MSDVERTGNHPALQRITKPPGTWKCRTCGYGPLDNETKYCVSCGRDWYGNPGRIPTDKPYRPGLRPEATEY